MSLPYMVHIRMDVFIRIHSTYSLYFHYRATGQSYFNLCAEIMYGRCRYHVLCRLTD